MKHEPIQTSVSPELAKWLKARAAEAGLSVAAYVRVELTRAWSADKLARARRR